MVFDRLEPITRTHRVGAAASNKCGISGTVARAGGTRTTATARGTRNGSRVSDARTRASRAANACGSPTRFSRARGRNDAQITDHSADGRSVPKPDADRRVDVRASDRRARSRRHVLLHARGVAT